MPSLRVEFVRNDLVETVHPVSAVLVECGETRWAIGEDVSSFWRSASKPFQLLGSLDALPAAAVAALDDKDLALGAASHNGEPGHTERVASLLARFELDESGLQCGAHLPMHEPTARAVATPQLLHSNCSGKHSFMLAACVAQGLDPDYRPLAHPLQAQNHACLDALAGHHHQTGVDGCSIPTFFAPLSAQARAWSELAVAMRNADSRLGRIGRAMQQEPWWMSGTGRLDLAVVERAPVPMAVKIGAEGLFCVAIPSAGAGVAVKVHSGNTDALAVAVRAVLAELGFPLGGPWPWSTVHNIRGAEVGARRAVWG